MAPTKDSKPKKKLYNPYAKEWVSASSEKGQQLKILIKNCKKCKSDEIYDPDAQKCVKRTPKNVARLKEFVKFCDVYRVEKIKLKNTDKLLFGKIINARLPGGNVKIKDIVGATRAKVAAYELEKSNRDKLKILAAFIPITLAITGFVASNPKALTFIKNKIMTISKESPLLNRIFSGLFKSKTITSEEIFIPGKNSLTVRLNKDDLITKQRIEKDGVGTIDPATNIATVNSAKLGIKGINPFTNLSSYVITYDVDKRSYSLNYSFAPVVSSVPEFRTGFFQPSKPLTDIMNQGTSSSAPKTNLDDIVVDYADRKTKTNRLLEEVKQINQITDKIKSERDVINSVEVLADKIKNSSQIQIDILEQLQKLKKGTMSYDVVKSINRLEKQLKKATENMNDAKSKYEKISKDKQEIFLKYKDKPRALKQVENMITKSTEVNIIAKKLNEENVNALYPILTHEMNKIREEFKKYDGLAIENIQRSS